MTDFLRDIRDHLLGSTDIVNEFASRVYDDMAPQGAAYPFVLLSDISNQPEYALDGEAGTHTTQVQIDVWTDGTGGRGKAKELGELIRNRLSGYRGQFGEGEYGTARQIRYNAVAAPPLEGSHIHRRRISMDYEFIHSADVPTLS